MATVIENPPTLGLNKADNYITLQADADPENSTTRVRIRTVGAANNETLTLRWNGKSAAYIFKTSPSADNELPLPSGSFQTYYQGLINNHFLRNIELAQDWYMSVIEAAGEYLLYFVSRIQSNLNAELSEEENSGVSVSLITPPLFNLKTPIVSVVTERPDGQEDYHITLAADYNPVTLQASFNLGGVLPLRPHLPGGIAGTGPYLFQDAIDCYRKYFVRWAERDNQLDTVSLSTKRGPYYMLHGALAGVNDPSANYEPRQVSLQQPDWVYHLHPSALTGVQVRARIYRMDGSTQDYTRSDMPTFALEPWKQYWFQAGSAHLRIEQAPNPTNSEIVAYDWQLVSNGTVIRTVRYQIDPECHPWSQYLLYDNGAGACESLHLKGKTTQGYRVDREEYRTAKGRNHTPAAGEFGYYNPQGIRTHQVATGWYSARFIERLRQLLLGDVWLIDVANNRFVKVAIETNSIEDRRDDQNLFGLEFTYRISNYDDAYNNY